MSIRTQSRLQWQVRDDGSSWAPIEVGGECGVVAVVPLPSGGVSATAIVELKGLDQHTNVDEAQNAFDNWISEIGGRALTPTCGPTPDTPPNRRRTS